MDLKGAAAVEHDDAAVSVRGTAGTISSGGMRSKAAMLRFQSGGGAAAAHQLGAGRRIRHFTPKRRPTDDGEAKH